MNPADLIYTSIAMNAISRPRQPSRGHYRTHALNASGRPLCGGGHGAAREQAWQTDLANPNCQRCQAILARRALVAAELREANPPPNHNLDFMI